MDKYNKDHVISEYISAKKARKEVVSERQARKDVDDVLISIMNVLAKSKDSLPDKKNVRARLQIVNFGSFELRHVHARAHKNPQDPTAEPTIKPAHNNVVLSTGRAFEEIVN